MAKNYACLPQYSVDDDEEGSQNKILGELVWPDPDKLDQHNWNFLPTHPLLQSSSGNDTLIECKLKKSNLLNGEEKKLMKYGAGPESGFFFEAKQVEDSLTSMINDRGQCRELFYSHDARAVRDSLLHICLDNNKNEDFGYLSDILSLELPTDQIVGSVIEVDWRRLELNELRVPRNAAQYQSSIQLALKDESTLDSAVDSLIIDDQMSLSSIVANMNTKVLQRRIAFDVDDLCSETETVEEHVGTSISPAAVIPSALFSSNGAAGRSDAQYQSSIHLMLNDESASDYALDSGYQASRSSIATNMNFEDLQRRISSDSDEEMISMYSDSSSDIEIINDVGADPLFQ